MPPSQHHTTPPSSQSMGPGNSSASPRDFQTLHGTRKCQRRLSKQNILKVNDTSFKFFDFIFQEFGGRGKQTPRCHCCSAKQSTGASNPQQPPSSCRENLGALLHHHSDSLLLVQDAKDTAL